MPQSFDIAVIGAGIAGASAAADLARDHQVVLIERENLPGYHSTGRSAALFSEIYGSPQVRALSRASRTFLFDPPPEFTEVRLVRRRGSLFIATEAQLAKLDHFASLSDIAPAVRKLEVEEAHRLCPVLRPGYVAGALLEPDSHDVDVDALHQGYLRSLRAAGGAIALNCEVVALVQDGGGWLVRTPGEQFRASLVVNAAGAWADRIADLAGAMPVALEPRQRTALTVDPPPLADIDSWPMVIDMDESFYIKPDAGQLILSPADETLVPPGDVQPEEWDVAVAIDRIEKATTMSFSRVRRKWAGLRSFAPDRSPVVGFDETAPGFFWLAGQGGYGIQTAPALARLAGSLLRGLGVPGDLCAEGVEEQCLAPRRVQGLAGTARNAGVVIQAGEQG